MSRSYTGHADTSKYRGTGLMNLSPEQLLENWERHIKIVDHFITSPRKNEVLNMLGNLADMMITAPASGKAFYHNAFPGGYIDHVNRVVEFAFKTKALWEEVGTPIDFSDEELALVALFHDLGKIGDGKLEGYIPQKDKWRQEKLQELYLNNPELPFMVLADRSLYILQKFKVVLSQNEFLAIRAHDGIYEDVNKPYFISHSPDAKFRTNLVYILHQADFLAARFEYQRWLNSSKNVEKEPKEKKHIPGSSGLMNLVKDL